jgi:hypothetical protein
MTRVCVYLWCCQEELRALYDTLVAFPTLRLQLVPLTTQFKESLLLRVVST